MVVWEAKSASVVISVRVDMFVVDPTVSGGDEVWFVCPAGGTG